jgi:TatA/E family protein of Tat protein translocase
MCGLGTTELLLILGIVLLLFGAKKLPELAKGLGGAMREFKKSTREQDETAELGGRREEDVRAVTKGSDDSKDDDAPTKPQGGGEGTA